MDFNYFSLFSIVCGILTYICIYYTKTQKQKNIETYDDKQNFKEMELCGLTF